MHRLRLILGSAGGLLLLGWVGLLALPDAKGDGAPDVGQLAPLDSALAGPWRPIASFPAEGSNGDVMGLDVRGDTIFLVQPRQWMAVVGDSLLGPFGSGSVGAPDYIAAGQGILRVPDGVLIVDGSRQLLSTWSLEGERGVEVSLRSVDASYGSPTTIASDGAAGALVGVMAVDDRGTQHLALRVAAASVARADTLLEDSFARRLGAAWDFPLLARNATGAVAIFSADSWRFRVLGSDGRLLVDTVRNDAPRWSGDRKARQRMMEMASQAPGVLREAFALREHTVPGRGITALGDRHWLVLSANELDQLHAELLDARGRPLARLWKDAEPHPVFAVRGALYRVRALDERTFIDRQEIRIP